MVKGENDKIQVLMKGRNGERGNRKRSRITYLGGEGKAKGKEESEREGTYD